MSGTSAMEAGSEPRRGFKLALVGGPDIDQRIDLISFLGDEFDVLAVGSEPGLAQRFKHAGIRYRHYKLKRRVGPLADLSGMAQLLDVFRHESPDIVHAFDTKPSVLARLAARLAGVPVILGTVPGLGSLYVRESILTDVVRRAYERLQRQASRLSDLTIFQNHYDARQFIASGVVPADKAAVVLGSGVRTDQFDPAKIAPAQRERIRAELGISPHAVTITMVSRLIRSKGVLEFAAAAQRVSGHHLTTEFLLVGPADDESIDRLTPAEFHEITRSVNWVGVRTDIRDILAASDVFVLPTYLREGIPRVLLEAASMGLPIVTTDSPGCNDVVEHGVNGLLVPARDHEALTCAVLQLAGDRELRRRFGAESRRRAVDQFDISKVATQTRLLYKQILSQKGLLASSSTHARIG